MNAVARSLAAAAVVFVLAFVFGGVSYIISGDPAWIWTWLGIGGMCVFVNEVGSALLNAVERMAQR